MIIELDYSPFEYQQEFHDDEARFRIIIGGRRVGKTKLCVQEVIKHAVTTPFGTIFWIAPTFKEAREIGFSEFKKYEEQLTPFIRTFHSSRLHVQFKNGCELFFKGSDNPDSLRGRGLTLSILDEAAFMKEMVWPRIIRPALSDKKGKAIIDTTPNGHNWVKKLYENSSWSSYRWKTGLNPLINDEELNSVKSEISDEDYRQEYLAQFITRAGQVYSNFSDDNIIDDFTIDKNKYDFYIGMDFGFANETAITFLAVNPLNNHVYQFDELTCVRTQIDDIIDKIIIKLNEYNLNITDIKNCHTDPAGNADELSSGISPVDSLRKRGFSVVNRGSQISPGLAMVRSYIKTSNGKIRYRITNNCKETIECFKAYQYDKDEVPLKDGIHDHLMDSLRYFFVNCFNQSKYVGKQPEEFSYTTNKTRKVMKKCGKCGNPFISNTPKNKPPFFCDKCGE